MSYGFKTKKFQIKPWHPYAWFILAVLAYGIAIVQTHPYRFVFLMSIGCCCTILTIVVLLKCIKNPIIVQLGGFCWNEQDFCRGWLITGTTGSGKTASALNKIIDELCRNVPSWGGFVIDDKGLYWEKLYDSLKKRHLEDKLLLLKMEATSSNKIQFMDLTVAPPSTYAKILCDAAKVCGQDNANDSFFSTQTQLFLENFIKLIALSKHTLQLSDCFKLLSDKTTFFETIQPILLSNETHPDALKCAQAFNAFWAQPDNQLGGVISTIYNFIAPFNNPFIADLIHSNDPTHSLADIDQGKIICISLPPHLEAERRYVHTLLKMCFYLHAMARFSKTTQQRKSDNLLVFIADEAQQIMNASSSSGLNDYEIIAKIREAKATLIAATQSFVSLVPPLKEDVKAKVLMANLANRISFKAADPESAHILSETFGKKKVFRGKANGIAHYDEVPAISPQTLLHLKKFHAVIHHVEVGFDKVRLRPL